MIKDKTKRKVVDFVCKMLKYQIPAEDLSFKMVNIYNVDTEKLTHEIEVDERSMSMYNKDDIKNIIVKGLLEEVFRRDDGDLVEFIQRTDLVRKTTSLTGIIEVVKLK